MNPFADLLEKLKASYNEVRARLDKALSGMGPIDQIEASGPVRMLLSEYQWGMERVEEMGDNITATLKKVDEMTEEIGQAAIDTKLESGDLFTKDSAEAAVTAAKKEVREAVEAEFQAKLDNRDKAATKRAEVAKDHGQVAANTLTDDDLIAEDADKRITTLASRVSKLAEIGVTETDAAPAYANALACSYDEDGDAAFDKQFDTISSLASKGGKVPSGTQKTLASKGDVPPGAPPKKESKTTDDTFIAAF